jgi:hypothetical protein
MIRRTMALILALALNPASLSAQDTVLTITVPSAEVHQGPSTIYPVIGHVPRGTVLPVSRDLGSWVKVPWSGAPDGVGYLHVTTGRLGPSNADAPAANAPQRASFAPGPATTTMTPLTRTSAVEHVAPVPRVNVVPPSHIFGVGGLVGSMSTFGATARAWRNNRFGIQFGFTRDAVTSDVAAGRVTSTQFEPGVVYPLFDRVSDYVWIRPYVGSVVSFRHQTLSIPAPVVPDTVSDHGIGFRIFAGSELTFANVPRFGLSTDVGYRRFPTPFPGFEAAPLSVSIGGHWYIK